MVGTNRQKHSIFIDIGLILFVFAALFALIRLGKGMMIPFASNHPIQISLRLSMLPYYAGRSVLRMFIALVASLVFTFLYARLAAGSKLAERILIPLVDILQSVPVLGFLSVTIVFFMGLFPHSLFGVECASIFAIFTGQVWNMILSFHQSITTIPRELREVSDMYGIRGIRRFSMLELPYAMVPLVWNSMMSFGGGWFFLAASETITVLNHDIRLPGIGSYMAAAMAQGNAKALVYAIVTMVLVIVIIDQLFWRPVVAWSQKFKAEQSSAQEVPTSWVLSLLVKSKILEWTHEQLEIPARRWYVKVSAPKQSHSIVAVPQNGRIKQWIRWTLAAIGAVAVIFFMVRGASSLMELGWKSLLWAVVLGFFTMMRVLVAVLLGLIWTVPVGVYIGMHPKISKIAQPFVQIAASFPANMFFPIITLVFLSININIQWGSIFLMMLGTQWYILFNVIAGAMTIPNDLREASSIFRLKGIDRFKRLILPSILPSLVTGLLTASGGAWNASIIAEIVTWKNQTLLASGLGSYIEAATTAGNWPKIIWGIIVMAIYVVIINRLLWHRLYRLAETKYSSE